MTGFKYQLKNIRRDKLCIITFLLPIIVAIAINFIPDFSFSSVAENSFGVIADNLDPNTIEWLKTIGRVTVFQSQEDMITAINEPSTQIIGVLQSEDGEDGTDRIETMLSGDELTINVTVAETLPQLFSDRHMSESFRRTIVRKEKDKDALASILIAITLGTAMFMGCTFNAMSIIGEKEDGIAFINEILPMTTRNYMIQKISLGFFGAVFSAIVTSLLCIRIRADQILPFFLLIVLSSFIAALIGLFIGRYSDGLMVGIIYIKMVMIVFLAPPILVYLIAPADSIAYALSYLLPSGATFYGLIALMNNSSSIWKEVEVLAIHCVVWFGLYRVLSRRSQRFA